MFGGRAEELTSRVSWSTTSPQAQKQDPTSAPRYRKLTPNEPCLEHASSKIRSRKGQSSGRASLNIEPESSVSNQWFSLFTERLLYRNQRSSSPTQIIQPLSVSSPPNHMIHSSVRRPEPNSSEKAMSDVRDLNDMHEMSKRSGMRGDFPFSASLHNVSRKYAHGPQSYLDDNLHTEVHHFREQGRPHARGKHKYRAASACSVLHNADATPILDSHCQAPEQPRCLRAVPLNHTHHVNSLTGLPYTPFHAPYGVSASAPPNSSTYEEQHRQSLPLPTWNSASNRFAMNCPPLDNAIPDAWYSSERRPRRTDTGVLNGGEGLDAFDLQLLESVHPEKRCGQLEGRPLTHDTAIHAGIQDSSLDSGQAQSLRTTELAHLLHKESSTSQSIQLIDHQLELRKPTFQRGRNEEPFNPYKKPVLFA